MSYTTFGTNNANYVLQLGNHKFKNKQVDIFEGIDALVIETGRGQFHNFLKNGHPQLDLPFEYCRNNKIPVFGTDARGTFLGSQRDLMSNTIIGLPTWIPLVYYAISEERVNSSLLKWYANWEFLAQRPGNEARNALNARKLEEFVVPLMTERVGRKPHLGLIFGAAHMGLKPDLQSKRRRDFTLWNWRNFNFGRWAGFMEEDLNLVQEANYNGMKWEVQTYTPHLFN